MAESAFELIYIFFFFLGGCQFRTYWLQIVCVFQANFAARWMDFALFGAVLLPIFNFSSSVTSDRSTLYLNPVKEFQEKKKKFKLHETH